VQDEAGPGSSVAAAAASNAIHDLENPVVDKAPVPQVEPGGELQQAARHQPILLPDLTTVTESQRCV
jgi:hypothetical protein